MTSYTASGARRTGDEYQDLQSAEVLVEWLERTDAYRWVRLEAMDGSLDDIQAEYADGSRRLLQVKFATDATAEWGWEDLLKHQDGKRGPKPSLLQKWKTSFDNAITSGVAVREAAFLTNRAASAAIRAHLTDSGLVDFCGLSGPLQTTISAQLGGQTAASEFFSSFHFFFKDRSLDVLDAAVQHRFRRLGGTSEGWFSLIGAIRRWIDHKDQPPPNGFITLAALRVAALWHLPPLIPQGFLVPDDYVAPRVWSEVAVEPRLRADGDRLVVVTGSPGSGKSTYLSWLVERLREAKVPVVRHHYFLSTTDTTPFRTAWDTAADAIIGQLRSHPELLLDGESQNPVPAMLREFLVVAGSKRTGNDPLVVVVDGLDHVWRDTGSEHGLGRLFDLLLPVPDGVVVVVGTQAIDVARLPPKLLGLCPRDRWLELPVLDRAGVFDWLKHHERELGLPEDEDHATRVLGELAEAFHSVNGGHPLILHYSLSAVRQGDPTLRPDQVRALPKFDPNSGVASYYGALWERISAEGHVLLHLLAGFPWAWPRDGLVQCLTSQFDLARLEQAERAVRHVLGASRAGVTAFHESLLAFVRALPDHSSTAQSLRPQVVDWLSQRAPCYWRWRHEWEERAKNGDTAPLVSSATLDWCVDSLASGRGRTEVAAVVAASGHTALRAGYLGVATERHYIDEYLEEAAQAGDVLSRLVWLALLARDPCGRETELNLFLSRRAQATVEELVAVAEVALLAGRDDVCRELFLEGTERWNASLKRAVRGNDLSSLEESLPSLIAASLRTPSDGPYQSYSSQYEGEPAWCRRGRYAKALARHCIAGASTSAIRQELRFLANDPGKVSFEAVDEIVRLACRDGFDPSGWIEQPEARGAGLFCCDQLWVRHAAALPAELPREVSFLPVWQASVPFGQNESAFVELARSYFFSSLATAAGGHDPDGPAGLDERATKVATFLSLLRDLAIEAAASKKCGQALGGAWFVTRLAAIDPLEVKPNDFDNHVVRRGSVARIAVAIAQDLEELHRAETGDTSLTGDVVMAGCNGTWIWEQVWIDDCVERRLVMRDSRAARFLIDRERALLESSRDNLPARSSAYASLAQFCQLHQQPPGEALALARLAARNLLGHGYHKDMILFDVLDAIRAADVGKTRTLRHLREVSPLVQVVDEITDGDETRHLKRRLAEVIWEVASEALSPYLGALQRNHHHWVVESCFTDLASSAPLGTKYEVALATTLVHEEALTALQGRAQKGDQSAGTVLAATLVHCGRYGVDPRKTDAGSGVLIGARDKSPPPVEDYPPDRLTEFVQMLQDMHLFGDEHLAAWTIHWRSKNPEGLLAAVSAYLAAHGFPHETQTAELIVDLALERCGREAAWKWLVAYHQAAYGWTQYMVSLTKVEWIWDAVRTRFPDRWLEFIVATSRPRWRAGEAAPGWGIERMVRFLGLVGKTDLVDESLDAAIRWAAGLAANMRLPDPAMTPGKPALPLALRLLVDRLDCPSRMVQERAAWSLGGLFADADTREATTRALLDWHAVESMELRSCMLLLVLHLARITHGASASVCADVARQSNLVPSIGVDLLLREFGDEGNALAETLNHPKRHAGHPTAEFSDAKDFIAIVGGYLAPVFRKWASELDGSGLPFSRQWEWEALKLAHQQGLSLRDSAPFSYHYMGSVDGPSLAINDRISVVLRSAYLRALHWCIDAAGLGADHARIHALRVAVMADAASWTVRPSERPRWWPADPGNGDGLDGLGEAVGQAVKDSLENRDSSENEIILFAAGPVGNRSRLRAEMEVRAFLQSARGPRKPPDQELAGLPEIGCRLEQTRLFLAGAYANVEPCAGMIRDWFVAPLAWSLDPHAHDWLLPERQTRRLWLPATWLFPGLPIVVPEPTQVSIKLGEQQVARYRYWNDDLRERHYGGAGSRVGGELLVRRECLESQLLAGAELCWVVTLTVVQRDQYKDRFGDPDVVGTWIVGGSGVVRPEPW